VVALAVILDQEILRDGVAERLPFQKGPEDRAPLARTMQRSRN
jgi:hypothetical protein